MDGDAVEAGDGGEHGFLHDGTGEARMGEEHENFHAGILAGGERKIKGSEEAQSPDLLMTPVAPIPAPPHRVDAG